MIIRLINIMTILIKYIQLKTESQSIFLIFPKTELFIHNWPNLKGVNNAAGPESRRAPRRAVFQHHHAAGESSGYERERQSARHRPRC